MMVTCWGMFVAWLIYLEILLVMTMCMHKYNLKHHELAHAKTAAKYGHRTFMVFHDAKDKAYVDQIDDIDVYHLTKSQYKEYFGKFSAAVACYDITCYGWQEQRITLAGPLDTTKRVMWDGLVTTVFLSLAVKLIPLPVNITFSNIILMYITAELVVCYAAAWAISFLGMNKLESVVKERIQSRKSGKVEEKKKPYGICATDATKLLLRKRYAKLADLIYAEENRDWFPNFDDTLKQMKELTATDRGAAVVDAT